MRVGVIMYQTSLSKGQELVAQRMTKELTAQGHPSVLITSRFHDGFPVVGAKEIRRNGGYVGNEDDELGISVVRVSSHRVGWPPRRIEFTDFISTLDRLVEEMNLDVLVTHSTLWNGPDLTAQFVSWKRRADEGSGRRLLFCHMSHFHPPASGRYSSSERAFRSAWNEYSLRRIIQESDPLLVATPQAERAMVELGAPRERCFLFPGGIESPRPGSPADERSLREKHAIPASAKVVTFLGTIEERKNVMALLEVAEALARRKEIRFVIAGRLQGEYSRKVLSRAKRLPNVSVIGEVSEDEKISLMRDSYLNITLSRLEALGLAQLEFMSYGVPVVTSGVGGQSWIVKTGETGVVLDGPEDLAGAAAAIEALVKDPLLRDRLGESARVFSSKFYMRTLVKNLVRELRARSLSESNKIASS